MDKIKINNIFVAVFDKGYLRVLVPWLLEYKIGAIGTTGTVAFLKSKGVKATDIVEGFDYDGRVKSLSRSNFIAILADKNKQHHLKSLKKEGTKPIDAVIVDLYKPDKKQFPETMDIGGQALIRAAIKNYQNVAVAYDKNSIVSLANEIEKHQGNTTLAFRKKMAKAAARFIAKRTQLEADYWTAL